MPSSLSCPVMEGCSIQVPETAQQKEFCVHRKGLAERPRGLSLGERTRTHRYRLLYLGWDPGLHATLLVPSPHLLSRPKVSKPNPRSWFSKPLTQFREFWPLSVSVDACRCLRCLRCLFRPESSDSPGDSEGHFSQGQTSRFEDAWEKSGEWSPPPTHICRANRW